MRNSEKIRVQKKLTKSTNRRQLLANTTPAEKAACSILSRHGIRYIKQYPIYTGKRTYYADIYIPQCRLVLEIDGGYHFTAQQHRLDENRSAGIRRLGYHVYRLTNSQARKPNIVMTKILRLLRELN